MTATEIAELICTRISHDLIGNIGSISNALELMEDDPSDISDITPILHSGSETLMFRLKFFRQAFGLKNSAPKDIYQMQKLADDYVQTIGQTKNAISIKWSIKTLSLYKITYLGVMILADVFIRGGLIELNETDDGLIFKASSNAPLSLKKLENVQKTIEGSIIEENPALYAPLIYMQSLLDEVGIKIFLKYQEKEAVLYIK